jgi:spermidine synthase
MNPADSQRSHGTLLVILYFLSGAAALGYEVLWARMLSLQFGVSIFGVVVTVGSFMVGLGAGSLAMARHGHRVARPIRVFGLLECSVGLFAFFLPMLVAGVSASLATFSANLSLASWYIAHVAFDLVLMVLPSFAMGAAFPMVLRGAVRAGESVGRLYGFNALGGVVGALLPVWLMPLLGWTLTAQLFAALGVLVGAVALVLSRDEIGMTAQPRAESAELGWSTPSLYAAIGAGALMLEVGWTRLFGMVLLRTEYVLAIIVAAFLIGIGAGSVIARRLRGAHWLHVLPVAAGLGAVATLWALPSISRWVESSTFPSLEAALLAQGLMLVLLTLPATLSFGAWLPLLAERTAQRAHAAAKLYGVNSIGAALGTFAAGFALIPLVGTPTTIVIAAVLVMTAGLVLSRARVVPAAIAVAAVVALAVPVASLPEVRELFPRAHADSKDVYRHEDAVTTTHVVQYADGHRVLLDDLQRMDASSEPDAVELQRNQVRLPLLLHANPRRVLLLGLGTGISASGVPDPAGAGVTAVELSRGAIVAAREQFAEVNERVTARIDVRRDDARRALMDHSASYDVIVGDLFHPDLAGRSALLSTEQFRRARARLEQGGVFVQWIALNQFDNETLEIVLRTFLAAFPDGAAFIDPFRLALVGTRGEPVRMHALRAGARPPAEDDFATGREGVWTWAGRYLGRIAGHVDAAGATQSELHPRMEFLLPRARYRGELNVAALLQRVLKNRPAWTRAADDLEISLPSRDRFERAYAATELALAGWIATLKGHAADGTRLMQLAYQSNPLDRWIGVALVAPVWDRLEDIRRSRGDVVKEFGRTEREVIEAILAQRPDFVPALKALERIERASGAVARADEVRARIRRLSPLDAEVAQ